MFGIPGKAAVRAATSDKAAASPFIFQFPAASFFMAHSCLRQS